MKNLSFESMTVLRFGGWKVRIWRTEDEAAFDRNGNVDRDDLWLVQSRCAVVNPSPLDIIAAFVAVPRVSAVEVTNENGLGVVTYVSWPD